MTIGLITARDITQVRQRGRVRPAITPRNPQALQASHYEGWDKDPARYRQVAGVSHRRVLGTEESAP